MMAKNFYEIISSSTRYKMIKSIKINKILWGITAVLSLIAGLFGVFASRIYEPLVSDTLFPAMIAQDLITVISAILALFLVIKVKKEDIKIQIILMAIMGYFFYAYGVYVIELIYTLLYFVYLAVFSLSFYTTIYSIFNVDIDTLNGLEITKRSKNLSMIYLIINAVIFNIIWSSLLLGHILSGTKPEFAFSIFILDLCFIMPAFFLITVFLKQNRGLGIFLAPVLLLVGFFVLIPLALTEFLKVLMFQQTIDVGSLFLYLPLSVIFLILIVLYLKDLSFKDVN
jgi:hypothetical protein